MMEFATHCGRISLYILNGIFLISGLILFTASIVVCVFLGELNYLIYTPLGAAIVLVLIGLGLCGLAVVGFLGASRLNRSFLTAYSIGLAIFFIIEIITASLLLAFYSQFYDEIQSDLAHSLRYYKWAGDRRYDMLTRAIDRLQDDWTCCGMRSMNDYDQVYESPFPGKYPPSCCGHDTRSDYAQFCEFFEVQSRPGCFSRIAPTLSNLTALIGFLAILVAIIQLCAILIAFYLSRELLAEERYRQSSNNGHSRMSTRSPRPTTGGGLREMRKIGGNGDLNGGGGGGHDGDETTSHKSVLAVDETDDVGTRHFNYPTSTHKSRLISDHPQYLSGSPDSRRYLDSPNGKESSRCHTTGTTALPIYTSSLEHSPKVYRGRSPVTERYIHVSTPSSPTRGSSAGRVAAVRAVSESRSPSGNGRRSTSRTPSPSPQLPSTPPPLPPQTATRTTSPNRPYMSGPRPYTSDLTNPPSRPTLSGRWTPVPTQDAEEETHERSTVEQSPPPTDGISGSEETKPMRVYNYTRSTRYSYLKRSDI